MHNSYGIVILLVYVDDIIIIGNNSTLVFHYITRLSGEFVMKDLGFLHYFLGVEVTKIPGGILLTQMKYANENLERAQMHECRPISTPLAQKHNLCASTSSDEFVDPTFYRSLVGALQYLTITRPDLSHAVNLVCQYMHKPSASHYQAVKRILHYLKGTMDHGLQFLSQSTLDLYAFSDADWVGCPDT